jgi:hypothetical protein
MLGYVYLEQPAGEFTFDRTRAEDFAEDLRHERRAGTDQNAWRLVHASLTAAFERESRRTAVSAELNEQIAAAVIGGLEPELFDSLGVLKSLWQVRLAQVAHDTQGMLTELLSTEPLYNDPTAPGDRHLWQNRTPRF